MKHNTKAFLALCTGPLLAVSAMTSSSESAMELEGADYLGCFHDNRQDRVLGDKFDDRAMTPELCRDHCTELGAVLMAVQYSFECWCSSDSALDYNRHYDMIGEDAVCDMRCVGDEDKMCGGFDSFNLYELTPLTNCSGTAVAAYEQCGGSSWTGSTCCGDGYECVVMGDGDCYSQCRPMSVAESTPSPITETASPVPPEEPTPSPSGYVEPTPAPVEDSTAAPVEDPTPAPVEDPTPMPVEDPTPAPVVAEEPEVPTMEPTTDVDEIVPDWPVPDFIFDFDSCEENAWMCCWTESIGMELKDNTDVCRSGDLEFPGDSEGKVHCHGFAWADYNSDLHIRGLAEFVKNFNHEGKRKYYGNIPGAETCGCVENMPEVSKSDCNTYTEDRTVRPNRFRPCERNDLRKRYELLNPDGQLANLVGKCDNA
eukprot:g9726.t1